MCVCVPCQADAAAAAAASSCAAVLLLLLWQCGRQCLWGKKPIGCVGQLATRLGEYEYCAAQRCCTQLCSANDMLMAIIFYRNFTRCRAAISLEVILNSLKYI